MLPGSRSDHFPLLVCVNGDDGRKKTMSDADAAKVEGFCLATRPVLQMANIDVFKFNADGTFVCKGYGRPQSQAVVRINVGAPITQTPARLTLRPARHWRTRSAFRSCTARPRRLTRRAHRRRPEPSP